MSDFNAIKFVKERPTYTIEDVERIANEAYQQGRMDNEIIDDLINLGYPHNFQHERSDIVNYMYAVTDIIKKAYKIQSPREKKYE